MLNGAQGWDIQKKEENIATHRRENSEPSLRTKKRRTPTTITFQKGGKYDPSDLEAKYQDWDALKKLGYL
jgi:hypothetical protein